MIKNYIERSIKLTVMLLFVLFSFTMNAQFTVTTSPPLVANNGQSGVTFELSTTASIIVTGISNTFNTGVQTAEVWYRIGGVQHATGTAPSITAANGWVLLDNNISVTGNNTTPVPIPNLSTLTIPANTDVGFFIGGGLRYQTHAGTPDQFTDGTVTVKTGPNFGYGGGAPNPTFTPRQFLGSVTYIFAGPCTDPPTAGFAVADDPSPCVNENVTISLDSASFGLGQTFQWQVSLDGTTWMSLPGDTLSNVTITAIDTAYYRAIVFCGNGSDTSAPALVQPVGSPLSGTYTINQNAPASATNYTSFTSFIGDLECGGVSGPVTVNVVSGSGPYVERVVIPEVAGVSSTNTVTINGNGNVLEFSATLTDERTTLVLDGTDWFVFDSLTVEANGASFAWCLQLMNQADNNTFKNCTFETSTTSTSTFVSNVVMSNSLTSALTLGDNANHNTFENNLHIGGYYGFTMNGTSSASRNVGNKIINSTFEDFYFYGLYARAQSDMEIRGNDFSRANRTTLSTFYGMFFSTGIDGSIVDGNRVHDNSNQNTTTTNAAYPIYLSSATGTASSPNVMSNNLVYNINNGGIIYALYFIGALNDYWNVYHNTVVIDQPGSTSSSATRNLFISGAQNNMEVKNNIFYLNRGTAPTFFNYLTSAAANVDFNNNIYYTPSTGASHNFGFSGSNISTFSDWQTAGFDSNGFETDPMFTGGTGNDAFKPTAVSLATVGANVLSSVPVDIEGTPRNTAPSPGAFQFEPPVGQDIAITRFLSPVASCPGSADVVIEIGSFASDTVQSIIVNWEINSVPQAPVSVTGPFDPGTLTSVTLGSFTIAAGVVYDIEASVDSISPGPDIDMSNNSLELIGYRAGLSGTFTINQLALPSATNFASFADLANELNTFGVCGDVVVNVVPGSGPYNEQVMFGSITGASDTSTITINGNGNELNFLSTSAGQRYTLGLSGASYFTIDSLRIVALGGGTNEFGWGVWMANGANHNTIKNCEILVDSTQTTTNYGGIIMANDGSNALPFNAGVFGNYNTIENNTIIGGYYGITCIANNINDQSVGNKFLNNTITDYRFYGIYFRGQDSLEVRGNEITRGNRFLSGFVTDYIMFFSNGFTNSIIDGNRLHGSCNNCSNVTSTQFAVYFSGASGTSGNENIFSNNQIYDINGDGPAYGLYMFTNNFWKFYHNTIVIDDAHATSSNAWAVYSSGTIPNTEFVNNLIYVDQGGNNMIGMNFITANNGSTSDYNVIFVPNGNVGRSGTTDYQSLSDWNAIGFDLNSVSADPGLLGTGVDQNRPTVGSVKAIGTDLLAFVPEDYEGVARTSTPDPGAYQFDPLPCTGVFNEDVDSLYPGGAIISWESFGNVNEWEIEWDVCGFTPGSLLGNVIPQVTNNQGFVLDSLPMGQCVCVYIREACPQGGFGPWSDAIEVCVPIEYDAELLTLISPDDLQCGDSLMEVIVEIRNNGFFPITSLPIEVTLSGDINQTLSTTYTGNLLENEVDTVVVGTINSFLGGYVDINAFVSLANDQFTGNDTLSKDSLFIKPLLPVVINSEYCPGDATVDLLALPLPSGNYEWYDVDTGGAVLFTGDSINVPTTTGTLYVGYADIEDSLFTMQNSNSGCGAGNMFNITVNSSFDITGFTVRPFGTQTNMPISIHIVTGGWQGTTQADWTLIESGVIPNAVAQQPVRYNLTNPIAVVPGITYGIYLQFNAAYTVGANTYSNADMTLEAGLGLCQPFDYCCDPRTWNGAVHYGLTGCSDVRVPVTPTMRDSVTADFDWTTLSHTVSFVNTSQGADSVVWDFGGLGTATGDSVTFQFPETDSFVVCLVAYSPCGTDTICQTVWAENISVKAHSLAGSLKLYPNPSGGQFELTFNQPFASDVTLELLDLSGKSIWMEQLDAFSGPYSRRFEREDLASGSYMLRINNRDGLIIKRMIINK